MDDRGAIRYTSDPPPGGAARRWAPPAAAAVGVLLVGMLAVLGGFRGSEPVAETTTTVAPVLPDPAEVALATVEDFAFAWNRGDAGAVDGLIDDGWTGVALPGFAVPRFEQDDGRRALDDAIRFLMPLSRLSLGDCEAAVSPPDSAATAVVVCGTAAFGGDYLQAVGRNTWEAVPIPATAAALERGLTFEIREDRILSIGGGEIEFTPQAYCMWVESNLGGPYVPSFDLACLPSTTASDVSAHASASAAYVEAGAPLPSWPDAATRLAASYVDRFVLFHELGDTITIAEWLAPGISAADLPGFPGGDPGVAMSDYLGWSSRLVDIDVGECSLDYGDGTTIVTCPDLEVTGLWMDEPVAQPTRFTILSLRRQGPVARSPGRILAVEPLIDDIVPIEGACKILRGARPATAAAAFTADCEPVLTREAANRLAAALEAPGAPATGGS